MGAAVSGLEHVYDAPGRVEFELDGHRLSLTAFPGPAAGRLTAGPPAADGTVVLDFNCAVTLPCAHAAWQPACCR